MAEKITFDQLVARREQREADRLKVGQLNIPGTDTYLEAQMPPQKAVLELYGEMAAAKTGTDGVEVGRHALYAVCPQLRSKKLQEELGTAEDPMSTIDKLFSVREIDQLGGEALTFLGLVPEENETKTDTVKN